MIQFLLSLLDDEGAITIPGAIKARVVRTLHSMSSDAGHGEGVGLILGGSTVCDVVMMLL